MKNNLMKMVSMLIIFSITMEYIPSFAGSMEHDEIAQEEYKALPFAVKYALEQLRMVLTKDKVQSLMPHASALLDETPVSDIAIPLGLDTVTVS